MCGCSGCKYLLACIIYYRSDTLGLGSSRSFMRVFILKELYTPFYCVLSLYYYNCYDCRAFLVVWIHLCYWTFPFLTWKPLSWSAHPHVLFSSLLGLKTPAATPLDSFGTHSFSSSKQLRLFLRQKEEKFSTKIITPHARLLGPAKKEHGKKKTRLM